LLDYFFDEPKQKPTNDRLRRLLNNSNYYTRCKDPHKCFPAPKNNQRLKVKYNKF